jgi:alpha-L-rhamnosidase
LLQKLKHGFHRAFFNASSGSYVGDYQTGQILPLYFNVTPAEHQATVVAALVRSITNPSGPTHDPKHYCNGTTPCLASGFWGTRYALQVLTRYGHADLALAIATKTDAPSWGAMALSRPGTFWESWVGQSRDHPALGGGIATYLYALAGFHEQSSASRIVIEVPDSYVATKLGSANVSVSVSSSLSRASLQWQMEERVFEAAVYVPVGFTGEAWASFPPPLACIGTAGSAEVAQLWQDGQLVRAALGGDGRAVGIPLRTGRSDFRFACG